VQVASEPGVRDAHEGRAVLASGEDPFDRSGRIVGGPLDEDSFVGLDGLHVDLHCEAIHVPVPFDAGSGDESAAASREPELRRDRRIDECLEDLGETGLRINISALATGNASGLMLPPDDLERRAHLDWCCRLPKPTLRSPPHCLALADALGAASHVSTSPSENSASLGQMQLHLMIGSGGRQWVTPQIP
jgi:hypothetical protein